ncbi:MAG: YqaA family protein [Pontibacterium sp.]
MDEAGLGGLFLSGFISSTLLPGGSEALFSWMLHQGEQAVLPLFIAVTLGNALGGIVTFLMGAWAAKSFPLKTLDKPEHLRAKDWLERFGPYGLLLSWLPIVGDPLCFMAGWLRGHFLLSALMITLGKGARYLVLILLFA